MWDRFFSENIDNLEYSAGYTSGLSYKLYQIREKFYELKWYRVYDFIEFLLRINVDNYKTNNFAKGLNLVFYDERLQYKIIEGIVTPLISDEEAKEVGKATESKYSIASKHIRKALELYSKRPLADYSNSIKESISAIEALVRVVLNKPNATLGTLVKQLDIHPALKEAIKKLYGWTSDEGGIRHSESGKEIKIGQEEARYMVVICSALVNYIISKAVE